MTSSYRTRYAYFFMTPYLEQLDFGNFDLNDETCEIYHEKILSCGHQADDDADDDADEGKTLMQKLKRLLGTFMRFFSWLSSALLPTQFGTCTEVRRVPVSLRLARMLPHTLGSLRLNDIEGLDKVLECVGTKCLNLQELILHNCKNVNDSSIAHCFSEGRPINAVLMKLNLMGTSVTTKGILVALERCQSLVELLHFKLGSAVSSSYHSQISNKIWPLKKYNLQKMFTPSTYLQECVELCPNVDALVLTSSKDPTGLTLRGNFKRLRKLYVLQERFLSVTRLLEILGSELEVLKVYGNYTFSVKAFTELCRNVKELNLSRPNFERNENLIIDATRFSHQNLKHLNICSANCTVDSHYIGAIFSVSPNLETVTFFDMTGITMEFMNFLATCGIARVANLNMWCCRANVLSLRKFIVSAPNLKRLSIENCLRIYPEHRAELKKLKKDLIVSDLDAGFMATYCTMGMIL